MKKTTQNDEPEIPMKTGNMADQDPTLFRFAWNEDNNPSEEFLNLLTAITLTKIEFMSDEKMPQRGRHLRKYNIRSVSVTGQTNYIQSNLFEILPTIIKNLEAYTNGAEEHATKIYELSNCKFLLTKFKYDTRMEQPGIFHPDIIYRVQFGDGKYADLPYSSFVLSETAMSEIRQHHQLRWDFLDVLFQFIELQFRALEVDIAKVNMAPFPEDKRREIELLEVWVALKEVGFLNYINETKDSERIEARLRDQFFSIFNLNCNHYNYANRSLKTIKIKATFLSRLVQLMEGYGKEKN